MVLWEEGIKENTQGLERMERSERQNKAREGTRDKQKQNVG